MIIRVENLRKSYGDLEAVKGISFSVQEGSMFSFLGVNGAGKSTTIGVLTTLLAKNSGRVEVGGFDIEKESENVRGLTGVVFQDGVLDDTLSIRDNLMIRGSLYGMKGQKLKDAVDNVIKLTAMEEFVERQYGKLSGGQKRRADIARSLVHTPKLLFLDEPTTGLDPKTRQDIWKLISDLQRDEGMTVFLTTHYMEEAATSDNIVIIHRGEVKAQGTPLELKMEYAFDVLRMTLKNGEFVEHKLNNTIDALPIIEQRKAEISNVEIINGTMDDVFLNLTERLENNVN